MGGIIPTCRKPGDPLFIFGYKLNVYACCLNQLTSSRKSCNSNTQTIGGLGVNINLYLKGDALTFRVTESTRFLSVSTDTAYTYFNGKYTCLTGLNGSLLYNITTAWFVQTPLCSSIQITKSKSRITQFIYSSLDPISDYRISMIRVTYPTSENPEPIITPLPYSFTQQNAWAYSFNSKYNEQSLLQKNIYIVTAGGTSFCTNFPNNSQFNLIAPYLPFVNNVSVITSIISKLLINSPETKTVAEYYKNLGVYSYKFVLSYFEFFIKIKNLPDNDENKIKAQNFLTNNNDVKINKKSLHKYCFNLYQNYFITSDKFSHYLRQLDACILFIYNIIFVSASEKNIPIDENFLFIFCKLIYYVYLNNLTIKTFEINSYYESITPKLLDKNYNYILDNWTNNIYTSTSMAFIIASSYAPLKVSYFDLSKENCYETVKTYINLNTVKNKYNCYKNWLYSGVTEISNYQTYSAFTKSKRELIDKVLSKIPIKWQKKLKNCANSKGCCSIIKK